MIMKSPIFDVYYSEYYIYSFVYQLNIYCAQRNTEGMEVVHGGQHYLYTCNEN